MTDFWKNSPPKLKFCGLSRPCDIDYANALAPDFVGFVFAKNSRRYIRPEQAVTLRRALDTNIRSVGVFVNEPLESLANILSRHMLDFIQLHGQEDAHYIAALRTLTELPLIQAIRMDGRADLARALASPADLVLLDSGAGGTGESFDWSLIEAIDRPYILAGGLTPENVAAAVQRCRPYAVDVSSGIESGGFKDLEKMQRFAAAARGAVNT